MKVSWYVACALLPLGTVYGSNDDAILAKLKDLEKRLIVLEEHYRQSEAQQAKQQQPDSAKLNELNRQVGVIASEVEKLRSGEAEQEITSKQARSLGLGPSAVRVYGKPGGVSLAGYGEMLFQNFSGRTESGLSSGKADRIDFQRAILYTGFRFNERFLFNSEVEFEHASTSSGGSASVEFAYLEYLINDHFSARGGLLLMPMGLVNEFHEPNVFFGLRPETERRIIPSTWRENGFGILASGNLLSFRGYVVNGFDGGGFSAAGVRGGRQKGAKAKASDFGLVGRIDLTPTPGVFFGGSAYTGNSGQNQFQFQGRNLGVRTTIVEAHVQAQFKGWDLRGLFAHAAIDDAAELNRLLGKKPDSGIAKNMAGGYVQTAYNLLTGVHESVALSPYYRFEKVNSQKTVPESFFPDLSQNQTFHTLGIELRPIYNIVIKTDFQWIRNKLETGVNQFNIALGYSF